MRASLLSLASRILLAIVPVEMLALFMRDE